MHLKELNTAADVMEALGGNPAVARLTDRTAKAVSNWRAIGSFPADTYIAMGGALHALGYIAPPSLWRMVAAEQVAS